jgi:hypothetical protein
MVLFAKKSNIFNQTFFVDAPSTLKRLQDGEWEAGLGLP